MSAAMLASPGADVAKLVDARDLKSLDLGHAGSTPAVRTTTLIKTWETAGWPRKFS